MKTLTEQLVNYARYHRDPRNINTHFFGIPLIVVSIFVLLSQPVWYVLGGPVTLAHCVALISAIYYLKLDFKLGVVMLVLWLLCLQITEFASALPLSQMLMLGVGLFVVGWVFQFIGHYYEGKKPAFVDDLMGLVIGPLFVVAEALFKVGFFKALEAEVVAQAGPVRINTGESDV